jgi:hypothetical protein
MLSSTMSLVPGVRHREWGQKRRDPDPTRPSDAWMGNPLVGEPGLAPNPATPKVATSYLSLAARIAAVIALFVTHRDLPLIELVGTTR